MDKFITKESQNLSGTVYISGAKNAVLPLMTACIINPGEFSPIKSIEIYSINMNNNASNQNARKQ